MFLHIWILRSECHRLHGLNPSYVKIKFQIFSMIFWRVNTHIRLWFCTNQTKTSPNSLKCTLCLWICHISIKLVPTSIWGVNSDDVAVNLTDGLSCQMPHKQGLNWSILTKNFKDEINRFQKILCNIVLVNFYLLSNRSLNYI